MKSIFRALFALLVISVLFLVMPSKAADTTDSSNTGLVISPPIREQEVKPGASYSGVIKVSNLNTQANLQVDVSVQDFSAKGENGEQEFIDSETNSGNYALGKWITVEKSFLLDADKTEEVSYTVTVPVDAEPGGHYGVVFFTPKVVSTLNGSGVVAVPKIGALILLTVPGNIAYDGSIKEFKTDKTYYLDIANTTNFLTRFENLSAVHVKPTGDISIKNTLGQTVATLKVNEKAGNVLPDSIRQFENSWDKKYGFGRYSASVALAYATGKTATASFAFWILPWKLIAIGLAVLVILIWIIKHISWRKPRIAPAAPTAPPSTQGVPTGENKQ